MRRDVRSMPVSTHTRWMRTDAEREAHLVDLVADDDLDDSAGDVRLELREPFGERVEGLAVRDVVHEDDALRAAVIGRGDRPETLLPGRVLSRVAWMSHTRCERGGVGGVCAEDDGIWGRRGDAPICSA